MFKLNGCLLLNWPDGVHLGTTYFIHSVIKAPLVQPQILDFLEFCLVQQLITGRGNTTVEIPAERV